MTTYDVLIIGAGPAGMMAAISLAEAGLKICIVEKTDGAGKKLLLAGGGRCNISHAGTPRELLPHYNGKERFVKHALYNFSGDDLRKFFNLEGVETVADDEGKIFPQSMKSRDVVQALLRFCRQKNISIIHNSPVLKIDKKESSFTVVTEGAAYSAKTILIATGGASYPQTGSTGDGYVLAASFGHSRAVPRPALAPLIIDDYKFSSCSGISLTKVKMTLVRGNKPVASKEGDLLFTHTGLSGPGILDLSRWAESGDVLEVAFVKIERAEEFERILLKTIAYHGSWSLKKCLSEFGLPQRLLDRSLDVLGIPPETIGATLDKKNRRLLVENLCGFPFVIEKVGGFREAMVTRGGVALDEVDPSSMMSRLVSGLYFAGEVLDVDGDTGGYNLQFAFSTGVLAGRAMVKAIADCGMPVLRSTAEGGRIAD
jgi:predicted Rossmann fold flavoprotein